MFVSGYPRLIVHFGCDRLSVAWTAHDKLLEAPEDAASAANNAKSATPSNTPTLIACNLPRREKKNAFRWEGLPTPAHCCFEFNLGQRVLHSCLVPKQEHRPKRHQYPPEATLGRENTGDAVLQWSIKVQRGDCFHTLTQHQRRRLPVGILQQSHNETAWLFYGLLARSGSIRGIRDRYSCALHEEEQPGYRESVKVSLVLSV